MEATINKSECIHEFTRIGYYSYHNVCSGKVYYVDWGFVQWADFSSVIVLLLVLLVIGTVVARDLIKGSR